MYHATYLQERTVMKKNIILLICLVMLPLQVLTVSAQNRKMDMAEYEKRIKENSNISEEEYRKMLEDDVELKMREAALDKEYSSKFEKVLTPEKLYRAQQAERSFIQKEVSNFRSNRGNGRNR